MKTDKYTECPLKAAGLKIAYLSELGTIILDVDEKCICTVGKCLNVDKHDEQRCTLEELRQLNQQAVCRRAYQSGD